MPESYRVKLSDPKQFDVIASAFSGAPGVEQVQDQRELLNPLFDVITLPDRTAPSSSPGSWCVLYLLINTTMIRLSAFTRRRETGIMRLVGASNLTIQMPFILETVLATVRRGRAGDRAALVRSSTSSSRACCPTPPGSPTSSG